MDGIIYQLGGNAPSVICGDVSGQHGMTVFETTKMDFRFKTFSRFVAFDHTF